jgi:hypothetical protein
VCVGGDDRSRAKAAESACASRARRATWTRRPSQALEGRTLKQSYVRHLPRRLADEAGVERRLHPHALRHTYAANGSRGHADSCAIRSAKPPWRHGPIATGRGPCPRHRDDDAQGAELGLGRISETTGETAGRLVDVEVVGDDLHVQEPKDEQCESRHPDECEHNQDEARKSVGREVSRATWQPSALSGRFGGHPITMIRRKLGPRALRCTLVRARMRARRGSSGPPGAGPIQARTRSGDSAHSFLSRPNSRSTAVRPLLIGAFGGSRRQSLHADES